MRGLQSHIGARIPHVSGGPTPPLVPLIFTAESVDQVDRVALGLPFDGPAVAAKADFLANVANPGYLTFESVTTTDVFDTVPLGPFSFDAPQAAYAATFTTTGVNGLQRTLDLLAHDVDDLGRFNTTPGLASTKILEFNDNCTITLSAPTYCFGLYATDVGDFDGQSKITITDTTGSTTYTIPNSGIASANGNLIFWGIVNNHPVLSATLFNVVVSPPSDVTGLDDLVVADLL